MGKLIVFEGGKKTENNKDKEIELRRSEALIAREVQETAAAALFLLEDDYDFLTFALDKYGAGDDLVENGGLLTEHEIIEVIERCKQLNSYITHFAIDLQKRIKN